MNEDLTPPSPALEAELLATLPPEHKAVLRRILIARDALVVRLTRAQESLASYDEDPPVFWGQSADDGALVAWVERQERALSALRAALSEPGEAP